MSSLAPFTDARNKLTAANLGVPIAWPNEPFAEPEPPGLWLAVEMTCDVLAPIEIGAGAWQEHGSLYVHVMAPADSGTDGARTLAKNVANVFRGLPAQNPAYFSASLGLGALADTQGMWWTLSVRVDYRYQDIST